MEEGGTMKATVGRIVHYQAFGTPGGEFKSVPRAAIITDVHADEEVTVCVLNPSGIFFNRVKFAETATPGHWNWPPREALSPRFGELSADQVGVSLSDSQELAAVRLRVARPVTAPFTNPNWIEVVEDRNALLGWLDERTEALNVALSNLAEASEALGQIIVEASLPPGDERLTRPTPAKHVAVNAMQGMRFACQAAEARVRELEAAGPTIPRTAHARSKR
jgi:hypothetical protein